MKPPIHLKTNNKSSASPRLVVNRLKTLIKGKDPYTYGHMIRTGVYAAMIAKGLGMPEQEISEVKIAGFLHDLGKRRTPARILRSKTRLTSQELMVMKRHTKASFNQVTRLFPKSLTPHLSAVGMVGIKTHHEKWDGTGYPLGLKGEAIPLLGRILTVADSFDAMTSKREYNTPKPLDQAISTLKKEAGRQFDPHLVDIFIRQLKRPPEKRNAALP